MLLLALSLTPAALAHPFGGARPGHDILLQVSAGGVELQYQAALPTHDVLAELEEAGVTTQEQSDAFTQAKLKELAAGLSGRVDADPLRWERRDPERQTGRGDQRLVRFAQSVGVARERPPGVLLISNGNAPDQLSYYRWQVEIGPELEVLQCSLVDVEEGVVTETRHGQWRMDEPQRELELRLRPRRLAWMGALLGEPAEARPVHEALALGPWASLRAGTLTRELALGALLLWGLGGAARAGRGRFALDGVALASAGVAALTAPSFAALGLGLYAAAALASRGRGAALVAASALLALLGLLGWCWLS